MDRDSSVSFPVLRRKLLAWFDRHQRPLPWRRTRDPFAIWVSEVMLQQTQVATVVPYFERFMKRFPTVLDLAQANEQEVLRYWEGLGYYRRARHLLLAARQLAANYGAELPDDPEVWKALPGVGRYVLGAVLSQAFDRPLPIVEANSRRVLSRLFGRHGDLGSGPAQRWLWETAAALVPKRRAGDLNQALMELGALICTAENPRCRECPAASLCEAKRRKCVDRIPLRRASPPPTRTPCVAVVVWNRGRVLVARRPDQARWGGLWEFPQHEIGEAEENETAAARFLFSATSIRAEIGEEILTIRFTVTRFRITMTCFEAKYRSGRFRSTYYTDARWLTPVDLTHYPFSSAQRKLARLVATGARQRSLF